jgi:hypothetical protein
MRCTIATPIAENVPHFLSVLLNSSLNSLSVSTIHNIDLLAILKVME